MAKDSSRAQTFWIAVGALATVGLFAVGLMQVVGARNPSNTDGTNATIQSAYPTARTASSGTCSDPPVVTWQESDEKMASAFLLPLGRCHTLMVTSGHLVAPDGRICGATNSTEVCVLVMRSTSDIETILVQGLDVGHTWSGTTTSSIDSAILDRKPLLFGPNSCGSVACVSATLLIYDDGIPRPLTILVKP